MQDIARDVRSPLMQHLPTGHHVISTPKDREDMVCIETGETFS